jgi:hypothetical protein
LSQSHNEDGTIKDNTVGPAQLQNNAVTAPAIAAGTISESKLDTNVQNKLNTVGSGGIADDTISTAKLQEGAVTTAKLDDGAVTDVKVAVGANIAISKINGLQTALDGKAGTTHSHVIADVTNLQATLDNKANVSHTHVAANISDSTATGRAVLTAANQAAARTAIGFGNVDNTSDADKPVSNATQAAINAAIATARQVSVNAQAGNYTLTLADAGGAVEVTSASPRECDCAAERYDGISGRDNY